MSDLYKRRKDDVKNQEIDEFDGNPCNWEQEELQLRRKEYIEFEIKKLKEELNEIYNNEQKCEEQIRSAFHSDIAPVKEGSFYTGSGTVTIPPVLPDRYVVTMPNNVPPGSMPVIRDDNICRDQILVMLSEVIGDVMKVFDFGATKHPDSGHTPNFLTPNGHKCSLKERGSSILRHSARTFMHPELLDDESGISELLHLLASVAIMYIRHKRGIVHPDDIKK
jgi:hypothetical protein